jgi:ligand-binding sensor domain-containing protein
MKGGLPSNEVYSILQDKNGFIWLGCGAGLYKFDGIRYIPYQSKLQNARAITGLTVSSSSRLYCFNFKSQTFYVSGDSLVELPNPGLADIINMTADTQGTIYVSHLDGISSYNEKEQKWTLLFQPRATSPLDEHRPVGKASRITSRDELYFISSQGIGHLSQKNIRLFEHPFFSAVSSRKLDLVEYRDTLWFFAKENNYIYQYAHGLLTEAKSKKLYEVLYNRKITSVRVLPDEKLWICTYKGIIRYDASTDSVDLYYPEIAFSDCILDREGNYWLGTLQAGLLRIPDFRYLVWNKEYGLISNDRLSKITTDHKRIFFTSASGQLGRLSLSDYSLQIYHTGFNADIQSLDYDQEENTVWFNHNNILYGLKNGKLHPGPSQIQAVKARYRIGHSTFLASSHGTFLNNRMINNYWARSILHDTVANQVWIATNNGLLKLKHRQHEWQISDTLLKDKQILAFDQDIFQQKLYALSFDNYLYRISADDQVEKIGQLPQNVLAGKLKYHNSALYLTTNRGLWVFRLLTHRWQQINTLSGLASDNLLDLVITHKEVWLSTGKGLQKVPLAYQTDKASARLYLEKVRIGDSILPPSTTLRMRYGQTLVLYPEAAIYSCEGDFQYAYRIKNIDTSWVVLPGNIDKIEIHNIPSGKFEIELKAIDCFKRDSSNKVVVEGYIAPPFWKTWWFALVVGILLSVGVFVLFRFRIRQLKHKQQKEIERINLENELRMAQQRALIAQMNPHFIFNVLNSIKSYIYRNDRENALSYLDDFSHLVRTVLEMSDVQYTTLENELKMLKLYIELEAMMLTDDFSYKIDLDPAGELLQWQFPSLVLQPFIENAFKHGLRTKKGNKYLNINIVRSAKDTIRIEITDNGIGRRKAEELNKQNIFKPVSFATNAIRHRLALINKEGEYHIEVQTVDLYEPENVAVGTKIIVIVGYNR